MQAVVLTISREVGAVLTGHCSPNVKNHLLSNGIEVLSGLSGTVAEVLEQYKKGTLRVDAGAGGKAEGEGAKLDKNAFANAARSSAKQLVNLLPILVGVVLLIGLFNAFVSKETLSSILSGNTALDTLWGTCFGSILAGNPINSYVIGGELLNYDVSLFTVTALIVAWVTVGLVQMPAEIAALGRRFALVRNGASFVMTIAIAVITVLIYNAIQG